MNQQNLANSIRTCNTIADLYQIMISYPEFIHHCYQDYLDAIKRLPMEFNQDLIIYLCKHYVNCSDITQDFSLLESYMTKLISESNAIDFMEDTDYPKQYLIYSLAMTFCPKEKLSEKATDRSIILMLHAIEDCYIPNDNYTIMGEHLAHLYLDIVESKVSVEQVAALDDPDISIATYKYIIDIHSNINTKMNFVRDLYATYLILERDENNDKLNEKFVNYFGDDVEYARRTIYVALIDFVEGVSDFNNQRVLIANYNEFIKDFHYNIIPEIQDCLISNDRPDVNMQIMSSLIYEVFRSIKQQYGNTPAVELLEKFFHEYLPLFNYTGPTITAQESIQEYLAEEANKPVLTEKNEKARKKFERKKKIGLAYRNYTEKRDAIDEQLTKVLSKAKTVFTGDARTELIEGKEFTALGLLKKLLGTAAIFSFGKIRGFLFLLVRRTLNKKTKVSERRKIVAEIETELTMIEEKIQDAASDGNREAKYSLMRTKAELQNALKKIKYGMEADRASVINTSKVLGAVRKII